MWLFIVSAKGELDRLPLNCYSRRLAAMGLVILVDVDGSQELGVGSSGMKTDSGIGSGIGGRSEASGSLKIW